jgi:hypothetical protein
VYVQVARPAPVPWGDMVSHFENARFQAAFAGGGVGLHFVELCREESLGVGGSIEPRR